jgi:hypothetical protein
VGKEREFINHGKFDNRTTSSVNCISSCHSIDERLQGGEPSESTTKLSTVEDSISNMILHLPGVWMCLLLTMCVCLRDMCVPRHFITKSCTVYSILSISTQHKEFHDVLKVDFLSFNNYYKLHDS